LRDTLPFLRRRVAWLLGVALLVFLVATGLGILFGAGGPAGLTSFGVGIGAAIGLMASALVDYDRTKQVYDDAERVEMSVTTDEIVFASDFRRTTIRRTPKVTVVESRGAFLITIGKDASPVLVPVRHLDPIEVEILRNWIAK
jgi:hypothetical protein